MRSKLIDSEAFNKEFSDREEKVKSDNETLRIREEEITRREKSLERALEDHLKNQKLTQEKIWERPKCSILRIIEKHNNKKDKLQTITVYFYCLLLLLL